jgi:hypothetical protein
MNCKGVRGHWKDFIDGRVSTYREGGPRFKSEDRPFALEELYTTERASRFSLH